MTTTQTPARHQLEQVNDLGQIIHTALRKSCSSRSAHLAWLLRNLDDCNVETCWDVFTTFLLNSDPGMDAVEAYRSNLASVPLPTNAAEALTIVLAGLDDSDMARVMAEVRDFQMIEAARPILHTKVPEIRQWRQMDSYRVGEMLLVEFTGDSHRNVILGFEPGTEPFVYQG